MYRKRLITKLLLGYALILLVSKFSLASDIYAGASEDDLSRIKQLIETGNVQQVEKILSEKPELVNKKLNNGAMALHLAAANCNIELMKMLISRGADVNAKADNGFTSLHQASNYLSHLYNYRDAAELLLANGAVVDARDVSGATPLHAAARVNSIEVARLLISKGADVNAKARADVTPIHLAAIGLNQFSDNNWTIGRLLIENGAHINAKAYTQGYTPLHVAAGTGNTIIVNTLIEKGADIFVRDNESKTALDRAIEQNKEKVIKLLTKAQDKNPITESSQSEGFFKDLNGRWIQVDNSKYFLVIENKSILWERGDIEGPEVIPFDMCNIGKSTQSVCFVVKSSVGMFDSKTGKVTRGHVTVEMKKSGNQLIIVEKSSDTVKHSSGFAFQPIAENKYVFARDTEESIPSRNSLVRAYELVEAGKAESNEFIQIVQSALSNFQQVNIGNEYGKAAWQTIEINTLGTRFDGIRFKTPPSNDNSDFFWAFIRHKNSLLKDWYIIPAIGSMTGFESFSRLKNVTLDFDGLNLPEENECILQWLTGGNLKPDTEYIIWFRFITNQPEKVCLAINVLPQGAYQGKHENTIKILGLNNNKNVENQKKEEKKFVRSFDINEIEAKVKTKQYVFEEPDDFPVMFSPLILGAGRGIDYRQGKVVSNTLILTRNFYIVPTGQMSDSLIIDANGTHHYLKQQEEIFRCELCSMLHFDGNLFDYHGQKVGLSLPAGFLFFVCYNPQKPEKVYVSTQDQSGDKVPVPGCGLIRVNDNKVLGKIDLLLTIQSAQNFELKIPEDAKSFTDIPAMGLKLHRRRNMLPGEVNELVRKLNGSQTLESTKIVKPKEVRASHIPIAARGLDAEQKANAKEKIESLLKQIRSGESFEELAKKYSDCPSKANGGDLGYFGKGKMVKEFEDAAFALDIGEVSDVIETIFGYHIIKVTDRR